jgi:hypothetical protein
LLQQKFVELLRTDKEIPTVNRITRSTLIGAALCTALVATAAAPAWAEGASGSVSATPAPSSAGSHSLSAIQASAVEKTNKRRASLTAAITKVRAAKGVTSPDKTAILDILGSDLTGMSTIAAKIAADTTATQAAIDYRTIFTTYRVYAVAIPQSRIAARSDRLTGTGIPKLSAAHDRLVARLAKNPSKSTLALVADLADTDTQLADAKTDLSGVSAAALAVTPSQFNSNHDVMKPIRDSLTKARTATKKAAADARTVASALR